MNKRLKLRAVLCAIFLFGAVGLLISIRSEDNKTTENTTVYDATVAEIDCLEAEDNYEIVIHTEEYETDLRIPDSICADINIATINDIKNGDTIFFRIENYKVSELNQVGFFNIVSLRTDNQDIFSLSDYNRSIHYSVHSERIAGTVLVIALLALEVYLLNKIKKTGNY